VALVSWTLLPTWHAVSIASGLVSSLLNHGHILKKTGRTLDRIVVRTAFVIDVYSIYLQPSCPEKKYFDACILGLAGLSYLISKAFVDTCTRKEWHVMSHCLGTLAHISMSYPIKYLN
jgi:hypothetical protein